MTTASLGFKQGSWQDPDDEDEGPGRVLTLEEFMERLQNRPDIFGVDKSYRLRNTEILTLVIALMAGLWASSASKAINLRTDAYEPTLTGDATVTLRGTINRSFVKPAEVKRPAAVTENGKCVLRTAKANASRTRELNGGGVGSIHSRIVKQGILSVLASNVMGKDVPNGDLFAKGGFADKIDAMLLGRGGIKQGGRTSTGRMGAVGMGFGTGVGSSGFGGPGIGGLHRFDGLMNPAADLFDLAPKRGPPSFGRLIPKIDVHDRFGQTIGGRSKSEIMRVVMQNISALRYAYNKRLREKPGLKGKITVKFAIDEFGNVLHCEVVESSVADNALENTVAGKIIRWKFERIDKPGDITEVVYPFVFST